MTRPRFTLVAGPNGSGKSTLTSTGYQLFMKIEVLDPDALARTIQVGEQGETSMLAGRKTLEKVKHHIGALESFAVETTLSGRNYLKLMGDARRAGFEVVLIYVSTGNVETNISASESTS